MVYAAPPPPAGEAGSAAASAVQPYVDALGAYATSPTPAYGLAALFAAVAPFSFVSGRAPLAAAGVPSASAVASSAALSAAAPRVLPPFWQLAGFAAFFAGGGYMIEQGDALNGAGTVTAWSLTYLFFHASSTLRAPTPANLALLASAATVGAGVHGAHYFSQSNWLSGSSASTAHTGQQTLQACCALGLVGVGAASGRRGGGGAKGILSRLSRPFGSSASRSFATSAAAGAASKAQRFVTPLDASHLPRGFAVAGTYAGVKAAISPVPTPPGGSKKGAAPKPDLALIVSATPAAAAGCFTRNAFKAAPVVLSSDVLLRGAASSAGARASSILVNSGCANAVTGEKGMSDARRCVELVGELLPKQASGGASDTLLLSTGVIGVPLPMPVIERCLPHLASGNVLRNDEEAWMETARAFMTTDTFPKLRARSFELAGRKVGMVGIDKGAGMIHPSMAGPVASAPRTLHATLLGLVCTDAPIAPASLQAALEHAMSRSFNCISVDGDMSTNDTILALANGAAPALEGQQALPQGEEISKESHPEEYAVFVAQLTSFCEELAHLIVRDGEGAEKFVEIKVKNAPTYEHAHAIASSISTSALVKCALHGGDANWGRILCAVGYAPLPVGSAWQIEPSRVTVSFSPPAGVEGETLVVLKNGAPQPVDEEQAAKLLAHEDIAIEVDLQGGSAGQQGCTHEAKYWTCDFSKEYISINGDYRS
ncbi:ArgJ-domain-containing protein [Tilletiopsis washingtonensis]|uniref:Arginine biosynthesis bifunctional protein ArgJ, mitochondrial n=1 Tax=Tilletiopsis washingtonensis TaxID=58919 RepID=A0A316Z4N6_9BASI|nr:ArgJ-domain-containing protein [Tilletiopsis washingtonensis]PWN95892.1 ArgJ-domain-containing protein [Tilletiopsis washingtonensis]